MAITVSASSQDSSTLEQLTRPISKIYGKNINLSRRMSPRKIEFDV